MQNARILALTAALALGLTACGETPLLAPASPSYDSGPAVGTGHRADTATVGGLTPSGTSTNPVPEDGSADRSGPTFGTGH